MPASISYKSTPNDHQSTAFVYGRYMTIYVSKLQHNTQMITSVQARHKLPSASVNQLQKYKATFCTAEA